MHDFDEARAARTVKDAEERSFKLGGETFTVRPSVRADALAAAFRVTDASNLAEDVEAIDEVMHGFLEGDGYDRYRQLRLREEDPVTFQDLIEVTRWMVRVNLDLPTKEPSPSTSGQGPTAPSLTAVPPSQAETQTG